MSAAGWWWICGFVGSLVGVHIASWQLERRRRRRALEEIRREAEVLRRWLEADMNARLDRLGIGGKKGPPGSSA